MSIHLIGGGWLEAAAEDVYGRFALEVQKRGGRLVYVLQSGTPGGRFEDLFRSIGLSNLKRVTIGRDRHVDARDLESADGLFVCGGVNPLYALAMAPAALSVRQMVDDGVPYAGFSAGAVVASSQALLGGWLRTIDSRDVPVCTRRRSEGLEGLHVGPGLGLLPFAVDVHGTQWGTLTRAIHALDAGCIEDCFMVDEDTVLSIDAAGAAVRGVNSVYRVRRRDGALEVGVFRAGDELEVDW